MSLTCPACGSTDVATSMSQRSISAPLGPSVSVEVETDTCAACGETGDFAKHNDEVTRAAEQQSAIASIERMLGSLSQRGCSMAYMERSLSLPTRTISRWKTGESSAPALALLRLVATYPWLLEVADTQFSPRFAASKLVIESGKVLGSAIHAMLLGPVVPTHNLSAPDILASYADNRVPTWSGQGQMVTASTGQPALLVAGTSP